MCGIFGISYGPGGAAAEEWSPTEYAQQMFPAIVHRGPHAFGWMSYNPETGIDVVKHVGKVTDDHNSALISLDDNCSWFVGHVRFYTNGSPDNLANNHPLVHGGVVGVHNGVLKDWEPILAETGREDPTAEVDSEAIFAAVNKWGITEGLRRINGNMVTVFTETKHPAVLHIARSVGRPLVYTTTPTGALVFASECCVIDSCEIQHDDYINLNGQYRHLTVTKGKVVGREQYKVVQPPAKPGKSSHVRVPRAIEQGGVMVSGLTDFFDRGTTPRRRNRGRSTPAAPAGPRTSLDAPSYDTARPEGTAAGHRDQDGGEYIGAGWYRTPDGHIMPVASYVEWAVKNRVAKVEHEAAMDAAADYEAVTRAIDQGEVVE